MEIYLLRHAPAGTRNLQGDADDIQRPLTPDGIRKMQRVARAMRGLKLKFDLILSSPFKRAKATAEIVADEFKLRRGLKFTGQLEPQGDPEILVERLASLYARPKRVLLVGHEPYLSSLAGVLVAGSDATAIKLKKGGLCKLTIRRLRYGPCAELDWLLTPKLLAKLE